MEEVEFPEMSLDGKIALVTGASKGLGKWISLGLAHAGADVAVIARNFQGVEQTAKEIEKMGRKALPIQADVSKIESIKEMVRKTITTFGRIDCLVNNAGTNIRKSVLEVTPEEFDLVSDVNFRGLYFTSQIVAKEMINRGSGKIINIGSAAGFLLRAGIPNSVYAGTKGGVIMFTKAFAEELSPYGIHVNSIAPGYFATPLARDRLSNKEVLDKILLFTPLKKIGEARDIIGPLLFLASDASDFITGQTIFVDGGRTIL
ncbi:MAG: glucose 1-dehydrogenase [Deltaproteobacteria bacterium]|jgi:NAD(P)-dependent dehydrogenase (short-subunit alcohol dehydrogenase family)|nr:glucose 1-dehydrogenase [Deltaproteobacteria bacterium]